MGTGDGGSEAGPHARDWEDESTSSESKSSSSGGRYRPCWRPRREVLNIDSIFSRDRQRLGSSPLPEDSVPQMPNESFPGMGEDVMDSTEMQALDIVGGGSNVEMGHLPLPAGLRGVAQPPRLIQRMESGYESSERNSSSPISMDMPLNENLSTSAPRYYRHVPLELFNSSVQWHHISCSLATLLYSFIIRKLGR